MSANNYKYFLESSSVRGGDFGQVGPLRAGRRQSAQLTNQVRQNHNQHPADAMSSPQAWGPVGKQRYIVTDSCSSGTDCTPCLFLFLCLTTPWNDTVATLQLRVSICDRMLLFLSPQLLGVPKSWGKKHTVYWFVCMWPTKVWAPSHWSECRYGSLPQLHWPPGSVSFSVSQGLASQLLASVSNQMRKAKKKVKEKKVKVLKNRSYVFTMGTG